MVWSVPDPVLNDSLLSDCGRLVGCGGSVIAGCIPCIGVLWFCLSHLVVDGPRLGGRC